jgi:hypothetical protein
MAPTQIVLATGSVRAVVGGNSGHRQPPSWTLASNAPHLQHRLRRWLVNVEQGRYALCPEPKNKLGM